MTEKYKYLPKIGGTDILDCDKTSSDETERGKYPCPCCGNITFPVPREQAIAYICHICMWENDVFTNSDDEPSDENHGMTLNEARENYKRLGVCSERYLKK